jgi:proteasome lid subunit RPN8/RPN11
MDKIYVPNLIAKQITDYFDTNLPEEACGILAGDNNVVTVNIAITNQAHSPVRFYMEPLELFEALQIIDKNNLDLIGIYHSHPHGPSYPSETDVNEFLYPGVATIIGFQDKYGWNLKAFMIENKNYKEIYLGLI